MKEHTLEQHMHSWWNQKGNKKKYLKKSKDGNMAYESLRDAAKTVLGRKFTVINAHIKKKEISK